MLFCLWQIEKYAAECDQIWQIFTTLEKIRAIIWQNCQPTLAFIYYIEQIFSVKNAQILNHLVPLVWPFFRKMLPLVREWDEKFRADPFPAGCRWSCGSWRGRANTFCTRDDTRHSVTYFQPRVTLVTYSYGLSRIRKLAKLDFLREMEYIECSSFIEIYGL